MLRTAIVGLGEVAEWHRRGIAGTPGAELAAVVDRDPETLAARCEAWDVPGYRTLDKALASDSIDWVHVCTPLQTHHGLATVAIEAGVPVLVEKPFVETRAEYESLMGAADDAGVHVSVVHNQVYYTPVQEALRRSSAGEFGRLRGVSVRWGEDLEPGTPDRGEWVLEIPGGEFGEGIAHPIYVALRAAGYPGSSDDVCVGRIDRTEDANVEYDGVMAAFTSRDGVACTIQHLSGVPDRRQIELMTETAHITVDIATMSVELQRRNYGPNTRSETPLLRAAVDTVGRSLGTAVRAVGFAFRGALDETVRPHDTHTPVIRREAAKLRDGGEGATPREELDWTNFIFTEINDLGA